MSVIAKQETKSFYKLCYNTFRQGTRNWLEVHSLHLLAQVQYLTHLQNH